MKKLAGLFLVAILPIAFVVGCNSANPVTPSGGGNSSGPTSTPTITGTPTTTPTGTITPYVVPTPRRSQSMVNLGTAKNYGALAYSGITNSGASTICGDLGLYPLSSVAGGIVLTCGGVRNIDNRTADIAKEDLGYAYTDAAGRTNGALLPAGADIGGDTLSPGLYTDGGNLLISSNNLTLDAQGNKDAIFIFQVSGDLIVADGRQVFLINSANANNIFWQVTGYCSLGTTASFVGNIMTYTSVTFNTGAVLLGRALAENGDVTLLANTITVPKN